MFTAPGNNVVLRSVSISLVPRLPLAAIIKWTPAFGAASLVPLPLTLRGQPIRRLACLVLRESPKKLWLFAHQAVEQWEENVAELVYECVFWRWPRFMGRQP
jgi:hypothetical protein